MPAPINVIATITQTAATSHVGPQSVIAATTATTATTQSRRTLRKYPEK